MFVNQYYLFPTTQQFQTSSSPDLFVLTSRPRGDGVIQGKTADKRSVSAQHLGCGASCANTSSLAVLSRENTCTSYRIEFKGISLQQSSSPRLQNQEVWQFLFLFTSNYPS
jgi:hypothetical protein